MLAALAPNEAERLQSLRGYGILDTPPGPAFDDITLLASHICGTPIALISLVDENRQWFKSRVGIAATQSSLEVSFCAHAILQTDVFVVADAQADERFADNALVTGEPNIRFYAGAPLITSDGHALGTLCVIDAAPRTLEPDQKIALQALGRQVVAQLELHRAVARLNKADAETVWKSAFLEAQVNATGDGILVVDESGRKILQNERFNALLKIPPHLAEDPNDPEQLEWVSGSTVDPAQFVARVVYLTSRRGEVSRDEIELKDGRFLDRYSSAVTGPGGKYYGRIWTFRDITERKRLEAQLLESHRMETVGKLAGGVAHEFNSILTAIVGQSELLLVDLPPASPLLKNVTEISQAAARATALTRQLLAYGRKQLLQPATLDLNGVVQGMEGVLAHLLGPDTSVRLLLAPAVRPIRADVGQIEQVIMNVALNARDAMPNGGQLTIETADVPFDAAAAARRPELEARAYVVLTITDTGPGLSAEAKARLFEPFFSTKGVGEGTGLGLSTCYGIVKQSGGHMEAGHERGSGAAFKIYLPALEQGPEKPEPRRASPDLPRGGETILLVEADPALREMAAALLGRLGYSVLAVADGIEALALRQQRDVQQVDALVAPLLGGCELAARLRSFDPSMRVLLTSAYAEKTDPHSPPLGEVTLPKPFTPSALARKLREALDQPR